MITILYVSIVLLVLLNISIAIWLIKRTKNQKKEQLKQGLDVNSPAYEAALYAWVKEQTKR